MRSRLLPFLLAIVATAAYAIVGGLVFNSRPLHVDEITQAFQARIFASGHLWLPTADPPEFFSTLLVVNRDGRTFAQFPPGWSLHLALGYLLHLPWLIAPLCGGVALLALDQLLRATGESDAVRLSALVLLAVSPWVAFNAASWMNHLPATMWLLVGLAAVFTASRQPDRWVGLPVTAGFAFGMAMTIRPVDAIAFLLPTVTWLGWELRHQRLGWWQTAAFAAGLTLPVAALLAFNLATTGHPLMLGYEAQWGAAHRLGFHAAPWGPPHTVARGWLLISGYYRQLQWAMYESPLSALIAPVLTVLLMRRLRAVDAVLLASAALLSLAYFAYWFEADYLGPRYLFPLAPIVVLLTARLPATLQLRGAPRWLTIGLAVVIGSNVVVGAVLGTPVRWKRYAAYAPGRRWDIDSALAQAGVVDGLILVREPWGAQVLARLWGRGVPHSEAQRLYEQVDTCLLYLAVQDLERLAIRDDAAVSELQPMRRDSAAVTSFAGAADSSLRMLPGMPHPSICQRRLREDRMGTQTFAPFLLGGAHGNVFGRDLQERDQLLLRTLPGRRVYQLRLTHDASGTVVRSFVPVRPDSALASWRQDAATGGLAALREPAMAGSPP